MARRLVAVAAVLLVGACSGNETSSAPRVREGDLSAKIVGGTSSPATQDAAVLLGIGDSWCSGALIAPNLILTARHCVAEVTGYGQCDRFGAPAPASSIRVFPGAQADLTSQPAASGKQIFVEPGSDGCGTDIAAVLLDSPVSAPTAAVRFTPATVGEMTTTVGYGEDGRGQVTPGRYQRAGLRVDAVGLATPAYRTKQGATLRYFLPAGDLATGESTCYGDSGGPLFDANGAIIGVTSRGIDERCIDRPSIYAGTAVHEPLIRAAMAAAALASPGANDAGADSAPAPTTGADAGSGSANRDEDAGASADAGPLTPPAPQADAAGGPSGGCAASGAGVGSRGASAALLGLGLALAGARRRSRAERS